MSKVEELNKRRKETKERDLKWFAEHDDKTCFNVSDEFKLGYAAAKSFYADVCHSRTDSWVIEEAFLQAKTKELIKTEQKIKDLTAEAEFYSKAMHEVEGHWLTRCVRFCQTFGNRCRYKGRDIYYGARHLICAILPRKKGHERDCCSLLYRTLQSHWEKRDNDKNT